ncbi:hypothetical protein CI102_10648 [Trichoderma harzianum]|nr:hypothetical protein CI102_10648 [Trichoderma harzianum]
MERKDFRFTERLKRVKGKLRLSRSRNQNDRSDSNYIETPQQHHTRARINESIVENDRSDSVFANSNQDPQMQEAIVPTNNLFVSGHLKKLPSLQPADATIQELWNVAYENLREEDGALINNYESKLQGNLIAGLSLMAGPNASLRDRMQTILDHKMNEVNRDIWKLRFMSSEIEARALVQPVLDVVNFVNEYIAGAVSANPCASIAWAGISLLLPGLAFISSLISQSRMREELYIRRYESRADQLFPQSHREYKINLERLYRQILKFQATAYCYLTNNTLSRLQSDIIHWNDWDGLIHDIQQQDIAFTGLTKIWCDMQYNEECIAAERRYKETVSLWLSVEKNVSGLKKAVEEAQRERSYQGLLQWLCSVDHTMMYNTARDNHEAGTNEWLMEHSEFRAWEKNPKSLLWLHGKAGSGKSILSSSVIEKLSDQYQGDASTTLAYFYFSFKDYQKQNVDGMLASLIKQITAHRPYIPETVQRLGEFKNKGGRPDCKTLEEALVTSMYGFSAVYIIIDALDECPVVNNERKKLLISLQRIFTKAPNSLHIFYTSRKEFDIEATMRPMLSLPFTAEVDLSMKRYFLDNDIGRYIDFTLQAAEYISWPESIKEKSRLALVEKADGMFQYVRCQFDSLQKLSSADAIDKALQNLPNGLDATYDRILQNIDSEFPDFRHQVKKCLKWLAFSTWPLTIDEFAEVFTFNPDDDDALSTMERLFDSKDALKYFSGLIVTDEWGSWKERPSRVELAHFSVKEYLISDRISQGPSSAFSFKELDAHMCIVHLCQQYHLQMSARSDNKDTNQYILENRASTWETHLEMIPRASWPSGIVQDAMLAYEARSQSLFNIVFPAIDKLRGLWCVEREDELIEHLLLQPYLYTARRGYCQLTEMLMSPETNMGKYLTQEDLDMGLKNAVFTGKMNITELFLNMGADLNAGGRERALDIAAGQGHIAMMELLLDRGAEINARSQGWGSALRCAFSG